MLYKAFLAIKLSFYLLNLHFVNQRHVVPHSCTFLDEFRKRKDHVIGVVRDDYVQWILSGSTSPSAVVSLIAGAPVGNSK